MFKNYRDRKLPGVEHWLFMVVSGREHKKLLEMGGGDGYTITQTTERYRTC